MNDISEFASEEEWIKAVEEAKNQAGIVAIGGISEHSQNYICLNCKHVYGYEPDSCAECNCKTFHKTDAQITKSAPVNDAVGGKEYLSMQRVVEMTEKVLTGHPDSLIAFKDHYNGGPNDRDWAWYLRGLSEGYEQAEFEGHKRGSQPSPQAESEIPASLWLEVWFLCQEIESEEDWNTHVQKFYNITRKP